jgi:hypothetical protein
MKHSAIVIHFLDFGFNQNNRTMLPIEIWSLHILPRCSPLCLLSFAATHRNGRILVHSHILSVAAAEQRSKKRHDSVLESVCKQRIQAYVPFTTALCLYWTGTTPRVRMGWIESLLTELTPDLVTWLGGARQIRFWLKETGVDAGHFFVESLQQSHDVEMVSLLAQCDALPLLALPGTTLIHDPITGPKEADDRGEIYAPEIQTWRCKLMYLVIAGGMSTGTDTCTQLEEFFRSMSNRPYKESSRAWISIALLSGRVETLRWIWRWVVPLRSLSLAYWADADVHIAISSSAEMTAFVMQRHLWSLDLAQTILRSENPRVRDNTWSLLTNAFGPEVLMPLVAVTILASRGEAYLRKNEFTSHGVELMTRLAASSLLTLDLVARYWVPIFSHFVTHHKTYENAKEAMKTCHRCMPHRLFRALTTFGLAGEFDSLVLWETAESHAQCQSLLETVQHGYLLQRAVAVATTDGDDGAMEVEIVEVNQRRRRPRVRDMSNEEEEVDEEEKEKEEEER